MHLNLEPIGIIKKVANKSEILIYSDFEQVIKNIVSKIEELRGDRSSWSSIKTTI